MSNMQTGDYSDLPGCGHMILLSHFSGLSLGSACKLSTFDKLAGYGPCH
uniref:Uncharacterized protein n=1 Tax=Arundo donax TaxID=35708 RepID=A0A0A8YPW4_ARUDO